MLLSSCGGLSSHADFASILKYHQSSVVNLIVYVNSFNFPFSILEHDRLVMNNFLGAFLVTKQPIKFNIIFLK